MKTATAIAVACISVVSLAAAQDARALVRHYDLNIPRQSLDTALRDLAQQTGLQIALFSDSIDGNAVVGPILGNQSAEQALQTLLKPSGLSFNMVSEDTIAILNPNDTPVSAPAPPPKKRSLFDRFRISQATSLSRQVEGEPGAVNQSSPAASSAIAGDAGAKVEEIVVTAQKRTERLQDVPISISVLSGADLDRSTDSGMSSVLTRVPGVSMMQSSLGGGAQIPIRGVSAGGPIFAGSSPTAYYLDSVPFGFSKTAIGPDPDVYDLERIEVLRGPQGTLYGASALNGVVRILTHDADPNAFELKARTSLSSTDGGGENYRGDVAINVPIIEGKLAARAVVGYQDLSGWIDKPNAKDVNDAQRTNVRLKVDARPTDELSIGLSAWVARADYGAPSAANDTGRRRSLLNEPMSADYDAFGLQVAYELPSFVITSATSYLDYINHWETDISPLVGQLYDGNLPAETFAQEITLNSTQDGDWRWTAGAMYRDSQDELNYFIDGINQVVRSIDTRESKSFAVFGELTRMFLDGRLELTAGLRYFEDDVTLIEVQRQNNAPRSQLVSNNTKFDAVTSRFIATWHPSDQMTVYASYSEGFRSGAYQGPSLLLAAPNFPQAEPDTLTNYEIGAKGSFYDGRLSYDLATYYIDWQDVQQQVSVLAPTGIGISAIVNGESASGMGAEFSIRLVPVTALELGASFSWNDLTIDEDVRTFPNGGPPEGVVLYHKGGRLNYSSEYTAGGSADYSFDLGSSGLEMRLSASASYISGEEHQSMAGVNPVSTRSDGMLIGRVSTSLRSRSGWTATLFADNINNEDGSPARDSTQIDWSMRVRPRTIGLQFDYQYR